MRYQLIKKLHVSRRLNFDVGLLGLTALGMSLGACGGGGSGPDPNPTPDNKAPEFSPAEPVA